MVEGGRKVVKVGRRWLADGWKWLKVVGRWFWVHKIVFTGGLPPPRLGDLQDFRSAYCPCSNYPLNDFFEIEPISVLGYDYSENCLHPWSAPHLEICSRLGLPIRELQGEISGSDKVPLRVAIRR